MQIKRYRVYSTKARVIVRSNKGETFRPSFMKNGDYFDYVTDDDKVQKLMESDAQFKTVYFLVETKEMTGGKKEGCDSENSTDLDEPASKIIESLELKLSKANSLIEELTETLKEKESLILSLQEKSLEEEEIQESKEVGAELDIFDSVTTTQAAKAYLKSKGIYIANSANIEKVLAVAAENNIIFPNLK
jgi:hypothetical protein